MVYDIGASNRLLKGEVSVRLTSLLVRIRLFWNWKKCLMQWCRWFLASKDKEVSLTDIPLQNHVRWALHCSLRVSWALTLQAWAQLGLKNLELVLSLVLRKWDKSDGWVPTDWPPLKLGLSSSLTIAQLKRNNNKRSRRERRNDARRVWDAQMQP